MTTFIVLRLIHIVVGVFWVGTLVFVAAFLIPAVRASGPAGGAVMRNLTEGRHFHVYMIVSAWITILSGVAMAWRDAGSLGFRWFAIGSGRYFGVGAVLALVATAIGMSVNVPTAKRLGTLLASVQGSGRPPSPEQQAELQQLQSRLAGAARVAAVLLLLATAAMAVARYAP